MKIKTWWLNFHALFALNAFLTSLSTTFSQNNRFLEHINRANRGIPVSDTLYINAYNYTYLYYGVLIFIFYIKNELGLHFFLFSGKMNV